MNYQQFHWLWTQHRYAITWNTFLMIINIVNNGNTVTLSNTVTFLKNKLFWSYVTSIGLGYPPIYKWTPPTNFDLSHNLCKNISNSSNISFFGYPYLLPFLTGVGFKLCICFPLEIWISRSWSFHQYWIWQYRSPKH